MKFTSEHNQISDTVRKFVANEINPFTKEWEKAGQFPAHELFKKLGDLGLLGIKYPTEFGGMGLDFSYSMVMAEALGDCNVGGVPVSYTHLRAHETVLDLVCRLLLEKKKYIIYKRCYLV